MNTREIMTDILSIYEKHAIIAEEAKRLAGDAESCITEEDPESMEEYRRLMKKYNNLAYKAKCVEDWFLAEESYRMAKEIADNASIRYKHANMEWEQSKSDKAKVIAHLAYMSESNALEQRSKMKGNLTKARKKALRMIN